jgi:CRP-like cAMP-binding protein
MSKPTVQRKQNYILSALPEDEHRRILPDLEKVEFQHGQFLYRPDDKITYVYFPTSGMISITSCTEEGQSVEIGTVGKEGMAGIDVLMGVDSTPTESMVQIAGDGFRMKASTIKKLFKQDGELQNLLLRYIHAFLVQVSQTAVCNRLHLVEQRLARWLLISRDRVETNNLALTQEFLATMLSVNRPSVTVAAIALQSYGLIKYSRGKITILNPQALEDFTCECYHKVKVEYAFYQGKS